MADQTSDRKWDEFEAARAKVKELEERAVGMARPLCDSTHGLSVALQKIEEDKAADRFWTYAGLGSYLDDLAHLSPELQTVLDELDDARAAREKAWRAWRIQSSLDLAALRAASGLSGVA